MSAPMVEVKTLSFDEQVRALIARGVADDGSGFETARLDEMPDRSALVITRDSVPIADLTARVERDGREVVLGHLKFEELETFVPIEAVNVPDAPAYVAVDIDLNSATRNVRPEDALKEILANGRSPLTIEEGVCLMLQQPEVIAKNWGFSMAGSRRGDQRVPAFWISEKAPKLGWCWDRNPHTWLGTASCARRVVAT